MVWACSSILSATSPVGDLVNLARIDAISGGADDAFVLIGDAAFTVPGQLRAIVVGETIFLQGRARGDGGTELLIAVGGVHQIREADLVL
jgi:hypothetical protein